MLKIIRCFKHNWKLYCCLFTCIALTASTYTYVKHLPLCVFQSKTFKTNATLQQVIPWIAGSKFPLSQYGIFSKGICAPKINTQCETYDTFFTYRAKQQNHNAWFLPAEHSVKSIWNNFVLVFTYLVRRFVLQKKFHLFCQSKTKQWNILPVASDLNGLHQSSIQAFPLAFLMQRESITVECMKIKQ